MRRVLTALAVIAVGASVSPVTPAVAGGGTCHEEATEAKASVVEVRKFCFDATVTHVEAGQEVAFINRDGLPHNIVGLGNRWGDIEGLGGGETMRVSFEQDGIYPYACTFHLGMVGAVVVGNDDLHAGDAGTVAEAISGPPGGQAKDASPVAAEETVASWLPGVRALVLVALVIGAALLARRRARQRAIRSAI